MFAAKADRPEAWIFPVHPGSLWKWHGSYSIVLASSFNDGFYLMDTDAQMICLFYGLWAYF